MRRCCSPCWSCFPPRSRRLSRLLPSSRQGDWNRVVFAMSPMVTNYTPVFMARTLRAPVCWVVSLLVLLSALFLTSQAPGIYLATPTLGIGSVVRGVRVPPFGEFTPPRITADPAVRDEVRGTCGEVPG